MQEAPAGLGTVDFTTSPGALTARLTGSTLRADEHSLAILLVDASTGRPVSLDYGLKTTKEAATDGTAAAVTLAFDPAAVPHAARAYLMVDTYPAAMATLALP